jgi:hypothetical protein
VERLEALEQEIRDVAAGFRTHYAHLAPKRLETEQRALVNRLSRADPMTDPDRPDETALLNALFAMAPKREVS